MRWRSVLLLIRRRSQDAGAVPAHYEFPGDARQGAPNTKSSRAADYH